MAQRKAAVPDAKAVERVDRPAVNSDHAHEHNTLASSAEMLPGARSLSSDMQAPEAQRRRRGRAATTLPKAPLGPTGPRGPPRRCCGRLALWSEQGRERGGRGGPGGCRPLPADIERQCDGGFDNPSRPATVPTYDPCDGTELAPNTLKCPYTAVHVRALMGGCSALGATRKICCLHRRPGWAVGLVFLGLTPITSGQLCLTPLPRAHTHGP